MAVNKVLLSMRPVSVPSLSVLTTAPAAHPSATPCSPCRAITLPPPHTSCIFFLLPPHMLNIPMSEIRRPVNDRR